MISILNKAIITFFLQMAILITPGKGRATDNIWTERFWKSLKYSYIYLNPCDNGLELFDGVQNHIAYYNQKKHQSIKKTPNELYQESITRKAA